MQLHPDIPLAALQDVIEVAVPIIFMVLYVLSQILGNRKQAKRKAPPRPPRPPQPQPLGGDVVPERPQPANQADALRREVEQFLRRAQGQPDPQDKPARPKPRPQVQQPTPRRLVTGSLDRESDDRGRTPRPQRAKKKMRQPVASAPSLREEGVAEHVAKHISSQELVEHAEHLGEQVGLSDERLESRLHEKFDHQLGSLQRQAATETSSQEEPNIAAEIAELLSQPAGMRQMIIAHEILRRPDERW